MIDGSLMPNEKNMVPTTNLAIYSHKHPIEHERHSTHKRRLAYL
jgi:hypothetical protein